MSGVIAGCGGPDDQNARVDRTVGGSEDRERQIGDSATLPSAHYFLNAREITKFRPGRLKRDILDDVQWRGQFFMAAEHDGQSICAITFDFVADGRDRHQGTVAYAIFVGDRFVKFAKVIGLPADEKQEYEIAGGKAHRPKPIKLADVHWLTRLVEGDAVSISELESEVNATSNAPHTDVGLTIAWLLAVGRSANAPGLRGASVDDYRRNAALRDQYNASRLEIGMTASDVEMVFKAKPIYRGSVGADEWKIYGSNEVFDILPDLHFTNTLVLFKNGKAVKIYGAMGGRDWLQRLRETYSDLPVGVERTDEDESDKSSDRGKVESATH
jgi:hypothetical protein